jgi:hypothetical protein
VGTSRSLFKFVDNLGVVDFFLRGIVKFTPIRELNDPSELLPNLVAADVAASREQLLVKGYSKTDLAYLRKQGNLLSRLAPRFQAIPVPRTAKEATTVIRSAFYSDTARLEALLFETAEEMSRKVGIFCLSQRYDSLPMWAHYARNARGLTVELNGLERVFSGDDTGVLNEPIPVRYEREQLGVTFDPRSHETIFFAKFADWHYEQEVRVVLPLDPCRRELVAGNEIYVYNIPPVCVRRLILGWKVEPLQASEVRSAVQRLNPAVEVVQAGIVRGRVTIRELSNQRSSGR